MLKSMSCLCFVAVVGCSPAVKAPEKVGPTAAEVRFAEDARPQESRLASIYDRSCRACHAVLGTGAPLTGHRPSWAERRSAKNGAELVRSVRIGLNTMPAMGLCPDCSDRDFGALIRFMAEATP